MQSITYVEINGVSFEYTNGQKIFEELNLSINPNNHIGLVGINGSGKSTLLKLILGYLDPSSGNIKKNISIGYVSQIPTNLLESKKTLGEYFSEENLQLWKLELMLKEVFETEIGPDNLIKSLSGGELMKLNICQALIDTPELLLLDEPTNHLDLVAIRQLIYKLKNKGVSYLIISHDVYFLDQLVDEIWEIDQRKINRYGGNYSSYKAQKSLEIASKRRQLKIAKYKLRNVNRIKQKEIQRTEHTTKAQRDAYLKGSLSSSEYVGGERGKASLSSSFVKKLRKMKEMAEDQLEENMVFERKLSTIQIKDASHKSGQTLFRISDLDIFAGGKVLIEKVNFSIAYGDRISIMGKNGSGKTTLVKTILQNDDRFYKKDKLSYLYMDQNYSFLNFGKNMMDNLMEFVPELSRDRAKELLGKIQFKNTSDFQKLVGDLSGGEVARLAFAILSSTPIELLILDEPTNNLDIETIEIVIEAINHYKGGLIVISHNIDFLSRINITCSYLIMNRKLFEDDSNDYMIH